MEAIRSAYGTLATQYVERFGRVEAVRVEDIRLMDEHLRSDEGVVLDVGCGPGHLTRHLAERDICVIGVDIVGEFLSHAVAHDSGASFGAASIEALPFREGSFGGVLAWYSLIHLSPTVLDGVLRELRRVVATDAPLVVGFFHGGDGEVFEHRVAPARFWSLDGMSTRLQKAGFTEIRREERPGDPESAVRPHAALVAVAT